METDHLLFVRVATPMVETITADRERVAAGGSFAVGTGDTFSIDVAVFERSSAM